MPKTITFEVPDAVCATIMCSALEGGIGYWAQADKIKQDAAGDYVSCSLCECDADESFDWPAARKDGRVRPLNYAAIRRGIQRVLSGAVRVRRDLLGQVATTGIAGECDVDADAADCIVQAGLLSELRYG